LVYSLILPSSVFGVVHEESGARLVLLDCYTGEDCKRPQKNRHDASSGHGSKRAEKRGTRNTRNRTARAGRLEKPGPKTLETQEILEQTKKLLLSRTNAYGDGCFRAARKYAALVDPSKYHGLSRFPCPACEHSTDPSCGGSEKWHNERHRRADAGLRET
jgi:hypothetical protein